MLTGNFLHHWVICSNGHPTRTRRCCKNTFYFAPPPGPSRAIQHPHPITAAPWANSNIPADGSSHVPALGFPPRPSCPNPSLTYASSVGDHQFGGPRYHSIYPSLTCDGYQQ